MNGIHTENTDLLFDAILRLRDREECYALFEDLCTVQEIHDLANRLAIVRLLAAGRSYQEIVAETGVSTATISRVKKCLEYGSGGYRSAMLLEQEDKKE